MVVAWIVSMVFIVRDLLRPSGGPDPRAWVRWARAAPFAIVAALSLWIAVRAPRGRKPFSADFSLAPEDLLRSMTKVPHLVGVAVLFLLAVLAFGTRRLSWAFLAIMLLGVGWEMCEATVVGH